jgi:hypothetical protein
MTVHGTQRNCAPLRFPQGLSGGAKSA